MHYRVTGWVAIQHSHEANLRVVTLLAYIGRMPEISTESVFAVTKRTHKI